MRERWRNVRRAPGYRVSSYGRARSVDRTLTDGRGAGGVPLSVYPDRDGYPCVKLAGETVRVCDLVLEAFVGPRPYGQEACHDPELSEGRHDCRLIVLRWDDDKGNARDKRKAKIETEGGTSPCPVGTARTAD